MNNIILVGFMGTGKSVISKMLAAQLNQPVWDTDDLIVKEAQKTIPQIFRQDGEAKFREWETLILQHLVRKSTDHTILATGGGIVLKDENWTLMKQLGRIICLSADATTILSRVGLGTGRPLLEGPEDEVREKIDRLLAERAAYYKKADWTCQTDNLNPEEVTREIIKWCHEKDEEDKKLT